MDLPGLDIAQAGLAELLGVSRLTVSQILNEHRALTPDMAMRLETLLGSGGFGATVPNRAREFGVFLLDRFLEPERRLSFRFRKAVYAHAEGPGSALIRPEKCP